MPTYYRKQQPSQSSRFSPRIQQAMQDAILYATPKVPEDATMRTGQDQEIAQQDAESGDFSGTVERGRPYQQAGYMKNDPAAGSPQIDAPMDKVKYYNRLESTFREQGDAESVQNVQKKRDEFLASQGKAQQEAEKNSAETGKKQNELGDERLKSLGLIAKRVVAIHDTAPTPEEGKARAEEYTNQIMPFMVDLQLVPAEHPGAKQPVNIDSAREIAKLYDAKFGLDAEAKRKKAERAPGRDRPTADEQKIADHMREYGKKYPELTNSNIRDAMSLANETNPMTGAKVGMQAAIEKVMKKKAKVNGVAPGKAGLPKPTF
jgi:hypothetical protein